ncbi:DEAD/DEAH box helicase [Candidatus Peregrinibacteria bacterium]|nr:DEAD/DEAH box helicase [Candidatus Peregrinibacteria bacterium]
MQHRRQHFHGHRHGGHGGGGHRQGGRGAHSTIDVRLLMNKVNSEAIIKEPEQIIKHKFEDFKIDPRIKSNIKMKGYMCPTPIQDQAIPVGLEGRDVIGLANTGTGKTAAFLIPLLNKMLNNRASRAIILAPTRELAMQIQDELREFAKGFNLNSVLCIGGSNIMQQIRGLKSHHNFVIGTPGRIIDFLKRKLLHLDYFDNVVLDEADRMVDMGFINDIRFILSKLPFVRQSFFFTATLEPKVEELIRQFLKNPVKISVKIRNTAANIEQDIVHVPQDRMEKLKVLVSLLNQPDFDKVLIFGRTKHGVEHVVRDLLRCGIKAESIHGNKSQNQRQRALQKFKKGEIQVLMATDVAARGLDISGVSHVINYDLPATYDDYVHRIGRTGRADKRGKALTFVTKN